MTKNRMIGLIPIIVYVTLVVSAFIPLLFAFIKPDDLESTPRDIIDYTAVVLLLGVIALAVWVVHIRSKIVMGQDDGWSSLFSAVGFALSMLFPLIASLVIVYKFNHEATSLLAFIFFLSFFVVWFGLFLGLIIKFSFGQPRMGYWYIWPTVYFFFFLIGLFIIFSLNQIGPYF